MSSTVARLADTLILRLEGFLDEAELVRVEPWPERNGELRAVWIADGSFSGWIPSAAVGLGPGIGRVTADGRLVEWTALAY